MRRTHVFMCPPVLDSIEVPLKSAAASATKKCRPMLSPMRRNNLGGTYNLIGSHSAVKLCRWQKSMLRGRGGCYKWTFYGIQSHRCMEATPSIACANKCTFCWRHNTNPTATSWKWDIDDPIQLAGDMVAAQAEMVKSTGGMPGVSKDRIKEGMVPQHCALSLVGEPILYPKASEFIGELHRRRISTFLVNNGQFPEQLAALRPVTQLYLSVDSYSRKTMKELDRPAFPDFWERFHRSVAITRGKVGRTVHRLTMIKGVNMMVPESDGRDVEGYAQILREGVPHFIEFKAFTPMFQGAGSHSPFRMSNMPTFEEVLAFAQAVCEHPALKGQYGLACVHEHSRCVLLADRHRFFSNGVWHTWIDFERFSDLVAAAESGGHPGPWRPEEYMAPTPEWALATSQGRGFDPAQTRVIRRKSSKSDAANVGDEEKDN
eukprot:PhM_4_TR13242/c0_g1_i1/m.43999/K15449/TYW1; tRNA wybutosine-synthesizing protein 1